jgi:hypothetical protein
VSKSPSGSFYIGLDNYFTLDKPLENGLFFTTNSNASIFFIDDQNYGAHVFSTGIAVIYISKISNGDTINVQEFVFPSRKVADPELFYGSEPLVIGEKLFAISKRKFTTAKEFNVILDMDYGNCKNWFSVISYSIFVNNTLFESSSCSFSDSLLRAVQNAQVGSKFKIINIKYRGPAGNTYMGPKAEFEIVE